MPAEFVYLRRRAIHGEDGSAPAAEERFAPDELARKTVVRDEGKNRYLVFGSPAELWAWRAGRQPQCLHEVIFGSAPQRLRFDVDAPAAQLAALSPGDRELLRRQACPLEQRSDDAEPEGEAEGEAAGGGAADAGLAASLDELLEGLELGPPPPAPSPAPPEEEAALDLVAALIEVAREVFFEAFAAAEGLVLSRRDFLVFSSSGVTSGGFKHSYHVHILPFAVADCLEASEFASRVVERLPLAARRFVDLGVYTRTQCFRLEGSTKPGQSRPKLAAPALAARLETSTTVPGPATALITAPGLRQLPSAFTPPVPLSRPQAILTTALTAAAVGLAEKAGVTEGFAFRALEGGVISFDRVGVSGTCRICGRVHDSESSLLLSVVAGADRFRVYEHCRRAKGQRRLLGELSAGLAEIPAEQKAPAGGRERPADVRQVRLPREPEEAATGRRIGAEVEALRRAPPGEEMACAQGYRTHVYCDPVMRDYELEPTLAVRAQMKMGKTKALRQLLDRHFPAGAAEPPVIRFVTFRQTFSHAVARSFPDFVLYSDVEGRLGTARCPRLIVQVESLHRVQLPSGGAALDLLILDEVESVLAQFSSGLHQALGASFATFQWMMRHARHVVCMDADLGERTFRTLERMRPERPPFLHWNRYARAAGDRYVFTADEGAWLARLHAALDAGKRLVIPTNCLAEARTLAHSLGERLGAGRVGLYCSETPTSERARHFADVHTHWGALDVLIYTPTCTAGISFELDRFDALFGYFIGRSCSVEVCRQMLGRVRNLRDREHVIYLKAGRAALPESTAGIRALLSAKRAALAHDAGAAPFFEFDAAGHVRFYETPFTALWLETARLDNLSQNDFVRRFIRQTRATGAEVAALAPACPATARAAARAHRSTARLLRAARSQEVAAAADFEPDDARRVQETVRAQRDVPAADLRALDKFRLRETFAMHGRALGPGFAESYGAPGVAHVFRSLCAVGRGPTVAAALAALKRAEAARFAFAASPAGASLVAEQRDLVLDRAVYTFEAHSLAVWVLGVCDLRTPADRRAVHRAALAARLRAAQPALRAAEARFAYEFGLRRAFAELDEISAKGLGVVNAILRKQYGVELRGAGAALTLCDTPVGRLFVRAAARPDGSRPWIPWHLPPADEAADALGFFLAEVLYAAPEPPGPAAVPDPGAPDTGGPDAAGAPEAGSPGATSARDTGGPGAAGVPGPAAPAAADPGAQGNGGSDGTEDAELLAFLESELCAFPRAPG
jgi:hypothetical protein